MTAKTRMMKTTAIGRDRSGVGEETSLGRGSTNPAEVYARAGFPAHYLDLPKRQRLLKPSNIAPPMLARLKSGSGAGGPPGSIERASPPSTRNGASSFSRIGVV